MKCIKREDELVFKNPNPSNKKPSNLAILIGITFSSLDHLSEKIKKDIGFKYFAIAKLYTKPSPLCFTSEAETV